MFCLKIGTHCILDEMIPNPESDLKIHSWTSLSQKSIHCLFSFETLLLFLDVQLILVLYFKLLYIPLLRFISSSESTKCLYFYLIVDSWIFIHIIIYIYIYMYNIYNKYICIYMYIYIYIYIYVYIYIFISCVLVPVLSNFTSFCFILTILGFWVFNYDFIYPTFICRLVQFLPLATTKI